MSYVPVVDISADPGVVGAELDEICRTAGFFQVTGHGIPDAVAELAWTAATRFFDLPLEDKLSVARPAPDYPYGYIPLAGESLSQSVAGAAPPDLKEVFNAGPPAPAVAPARGPGRGVGLRPQPVARGAAGTPGRVDGLLRRHARPRQPPDVPVRTRPGLPPGFFAGQTARPRTRCAPSTTRPRHRPASRPVPGGRPHRLRHADDPAAGRRGRPGSARPRRPVAGRGTGPRRVRDQRRRPDGALDQRPVAVDPAPGGRSARSRHGRRAQADHAVLPERQLVRGDLLRAHRGNPARSPGTSRCSPDRI